MTSIVFLSYHETTEFDAAFARQLASRLRDSGIDARDNDWQIAPGEPIPNKLEEAFRLSARVLVLCSPEYKAASNDAPMARYQSSLIRTEMFTGINKTKFVPILIRGEWHDAAPTDLVSVRYLDGRAPAKLDASYPRLLDLLAGDAPSIPPLGILFSAATLLSAMLNRFPAHQQDIRTRFLDWSDAPPHSIDLPKGPNSRRLLQIVHVSGMHVDADGSGQMRHPFRPTYGRLGLKLHDPRVAEQFVHFLHHFHRQDEHCPTWLVDSGNCTNRGDSDSHDLAQRYFSRFSRYFDASRRVYGPNDLLGGATAWPPSSRELERRETHLRARWFRESGSSTPLTWRSMDAGWSIDLFCLEARPRTFIDAMRGIGTVGSAELAALRAWSAKRASRRIKIVLSHYSLDEKPIANHPRLRNAQKVLEAAGESGQGPETILYLHSSGGPPLPALANGNGDGVNALSLAVGDLLPNGRLPGSWPSLPAAQVLTFTGDPARPSELELELVPVRFRRGYFDIDEPEWKMSFSSEEDSHGR